MSNLAERLRHLRENAGLSAKALDVLADLTPGHTTLIETGRRADPSASTVEALASVLGVTLDWLVTGEGREPSERSVRAAVDAARRAKSPKPAA